MRVAETLTLMAGKIQQGYNELAKGRRRLPDFTNEK